MLKREFYPWSSIFFQPVVRTRALLRGDRRPDLRLRVLRAQIKAGIAALDRGDFVEVDCQISALSGADVLES